MYVPEGYQTIMPYLILNGAKQFLEFSQEVFGAKIKYCVPRGEDKNMIMHAEIIINDSVIMVAEAIEPWKESTAGLFIYVEDADTTFKKAIAKGASIVTELSDQTYGRSGGVGDPYGNVWWITSMLKTE